MNPRLSRSVTWVAALSFGVMSCAHAVEYKQVNATASTLSFTYNQFSSRVYGTFSRFEGALDFDTENPTAAHAALTIQLDSIDAGSSDANEELKKPAWFDTVHSPVATFESTAVKALGENRYSITGNLTLRGITHVVDVPVLLKAESGIGIFDGQLILKRSDFKIGEGEFADTVVSDDINIRFRMVAPAQ
ncbi:YceI family protein [Pseudomonas sp. 14P_8.1_Bac3]|uniref:YceI family protein n=1 Tax=Pseudomonas sp. 14P_8.1_Bac3 TaxID=2971621 RepID=UPI0021CA2E10|nr:YceI family protein [Pseudomonas sp. 14P_8.1_Bac3]MCU1758367.1 YceI family protein [Pseudomonas sp. 14P_8.1_Bac3]